MFVSSSSVLHQKLRFTGETISVWTCLWSARGMCAVLMLLLLLTCLANMYLMTLTVAASPHQGTHRTQSLILLLIPDLFLPRSVDVFSVEKHPSVIYSPSPCVRVGWVRSADTSADKHLFTDFFWYCRICWVKNSLAYNLMTVVHLSLLF